MSEVSIFNALLEGPAAPAPTRTAPAPTRTAPAPSRPRPGTRPWRPARPAVTPRPKGLRYGDEDEIDDEEEELGLIPARRHPKGALLGRRGPTDLISAIAHECRD